MGQRRRSGRKSGGKSGKRKNSSETGSRVPKTPRNGGSPPDINTGSVSDSLRKANSVLFQDSVSSMDETVFTSPIPATATVSKSCVTPVIDSKPTGINLPVLQTEVMGSNVSPSNSDIMNYLKTMDAKINIMDNRLNTLDVLEKKVCEFDTEMKKLWTFVNKNLKSTDEKLTQISDKADNVEFQLDVTRDEVTELREESDKMKKELLYVQSQSMRNNLIFANIAEGMNETSEQCEIKVRDFMASQLKIAQDTVDNIRFERVHRMGATGSDYTTERNIVAKFTLFKDRNMVRRQSKNLKSRLTK